MPILGRDWPSLAILARLRPVGVVVEAPRSRITCAAGQRSVPISSVVLEAKKQKVLRPLCAATVALQLQHGFASDGMEFNGHFATQ
jgi:hypothetical protein